MLAAMQIMHIHPGDQRQSINSTRHPVVVHVLHVLALRVLITGHFIHNITGEPPPPPRCIKSFHSKLSCRFANILSCNDSQQPHLT